MLNWQDLYGWAIDAGATTMLQPDQLHVTIATVRSKADWSLLRHLRDDEIVIPEGTKHIKSFGKEAWALTFQSLDLSQRFEEVRAVYPSVDYPEGYNAHLTLGRGSGFRLPSYSYEGPIVLGPEVMEPFLAGMTMPRGNPINRNKFRSQIGLPLHNDDEAFDREFRLRKLA